MTGQLELFAVPVRAPSRRRGPRPVSYGPRAQRLWETGAVPTRRDLARLLRPVVTVALAAGDLL